MKSLLLTIVLSLPQLLLAQKDSLPKKPVLSTDKLAGIKWMKSDNNGFWFYYKPAAYFYKPGEFETIPMENGDYVVYLHEVQRYFQLSGFTAAQKNKEYDADIASDQPCIFIRSPRNKFWIFDQGHYIDNMEQLGLNNDKHVYLFRSRTTDKRYWIRESDFRFGPISTVIAIASE